MKIRWYDDDQYVTAETVESSMKGIPMFKQGDIVVCVDDEDSEANALCVMPLLQHLAQYTVEDSETFFVKLEGVQGEWHETRFVLAEEDV